MSGAGPQVTCKDCGDTYQCTPMNDYYQPAGQAEPAGTTNGVCFGCLLIRGNMDPATTPVTVLDQDGHQVDPLDEAAAGIYAARTRAYIEAAAAAGPAILAPYATAACPECGQTPTGDGAIITGDGQAAHYVLNGSVLVGCEGYFVADPNQLGIPSPTWQDWRPTTA